MKIEKTKFPEIFIIHPKIFNDKRGIFFESFNKKFFSKIIKKNIIFLQENCSISKKGVLRGLHYQNFPYGQDKLISCISGKIFDVAVDIRKNSSTFGKWLGIFLSKKNKKQLWIPKGFAHGFLSLEKYSKILYKTTQYYYPKSERTILWNDPFIGINWPINNIKLILSDKDKFSLKLKETIFNEKKIIS